jgi:hypothetical protein
VKSAKEILTDWFGQRRRPQSPRSVRFILTINGNGVIDIDSKLALCQVDCNYGQPVECVYDTQGVRIKLTYMEGGLCLDRSQ